MIKIYEMKEEEVQLEPRQEVKNKVAEKNEKKVIDKVEQESVKAPSNLGKDVELKGDKENSDNKSVETTDKSLTCNDNMNKKDDEEYIVLKLKKNDVRIALNVFESILETIKMSLK